MFQSYTRRVTVTHTNALFLGDEAFDFRTLTLAQKLGVKSGNWVRVSSARGELEVRALVTPRMKTLKIGDRQVTVVWMP